MTTAQPPAAAKPPAGTEPAGDRQDPSGRAAQLEDELAVLRAEAVAGAKVLMQIAEGSPHVAITFGGVTVGTSPTPVPAHMAPALAEAAAGAGVDLIQTEA
jgi:hypothetical protein